MSAPTPPLPPALARQMADKIRERVAEEKLGSVNPTPLLCREHVREFFLEAAKHHRPFNKFSRVSEDTLIAANAALRQWIVSRVKAAPSKGVTL